MSVEQCQKCVIGDISSRDDHEVPRSPIQQMTIAEILVFGQRYPVMVVGQPSDLGIGSSIVLWQLGSVYCIMSGVVEIVRQARW